MDCKTALLYRELFDINEHPKNEKPHTRDLGINFPSDFHAIDALGVEKKNNKTEK
jgi:hypothetical protein